MVCLLCQDADALTVSSSTPEAPPSPTGTSTVPSDLARPPIPRASVTLPFQWPRSPCFLKTSSRRRSADRPTNPSWAAVSTMPWEPWVVTPMKGAGSVFSPAATLKDDAAVCEGARLLHSLDPTCPHVLQRVLSPELDLLQGDGTVGLRAAFALTLEAAWSRADRSPFAFAMSFWDKSLGSPWPVSGCLRRLGNSPRPPAAHPPRSRPGKPRRPHGPGSRSPRHSRHRSPGPRKSS